MKNAKDSSCQVRNSWVMYQQKINNHWWTNRAGTVRSSASPEFENGAKVLHLFVLRKQISPN